MQWSTVAAGARGNLFPWNRGGDGQPMVAALPRGSRPTRPVTRSLKVRCKAKLVEFVVCADSLHS